MQHQPHSTPDIELLVARRARQAAEQRLLAEVDAGYGRRSLVAAVRHYASEGITVEVKEAEALMRISGGDARKLLNAVELVVNKVLSGKC